MKTNKGLKIRDSADGSGDDGANISPDFEYNSIQGSKGGAGSTVSEDRKTISIEKIVACRKRKT